MFRGSRARNSPLFEPLLIWKGLKLNIFWWDGVWNVHGAHLESRIVYEAHLMSRIVCMWKTHLESGIVCAKPVLNLGLIWDCVVKSTLCLWLFAWSPPRILYCVFVEPTLNLGLCEVHFELRIVCVVTKWLWGCLCEAHFSLGLCVRLLWI